MSKRLKALLMGTTSLALGTSVYFIASARERDGLLDEILFATSEEIAFQEEIGVPVYLNWDDRGEERSQRVENFAEVYHETQEHFDFFPEQFSIVNRICIRNVHSEVIATAGYDGTITTYCGQTKCMTDDALVHELAHLWHYTVSPEFWAEWWTLSGIGYYEPADESVKNNCLEYMASVASVTCYGAKNEFEDVAELAGFVYVLNHPEIFVLGFPNHGKDVLETMRIRFDYLEIGLIPKNIPRIEEKIRLLQRYGFFSEDEMHVALHELDELYTTLTKETDREADPLPDPH
ncbi:MAG: hypothetical protein Q8R53_00515 [Nanoarchaeota archaeon]|nr:hypothetical protein [Nanoarchaeota archaeon]